MKRCFTVATLSTLFGMAGCDQGTSNTSGVADTNSRGPAYGRNANSFRLSVPLMAASIRQGATLETAVDIERVENFRDEVSLKFFSLPEGVTVSPSNAVIKHGDENTAIMFTADSNAVAGEYTVKVFGHPEKGPDAEVEFRLTVIQE